MLVAGSMDVPAARTRARTAAGVAAENRYWLPVCGVNGPASSRSQFATTSEKSSYAGVSSSDDVDASVQDGTNQSMVRLAAAAEMWLGKPIIAINTATYWHALRANGINDRMEGFGRLLAEF